MTTWRSNKPDAQNSPHWIGEIPESNSGVVTDNLPNPASEVEPTIREKLGFIPLSASEQSRAINIYDKYQKNPKHGIARYLARIAGNEKGGGSRALISVFRGEMIDPYRQAVADQEVLSTAYDNALNLGVTVFEDDGYEDAARDSVESYFKAVQRIAGQDKTELTSLRDFLNTASDSDVVALIDECYANAVLRENFWHRVVEAARSGFSVLDKLAVEEGITVIDRQPSTPPTSASTYFGTIKDPYVKDSRYLDDVGRH